MAGARLRLPARGRAEAGSVTEALWGSAPSGQCFSACAHDFCRPRPIENRGKIMPAPIRQARVPARILNVTSSVERKREIRPLRWTKAIRGTVIPPQHVGQISGQPTGSTVRAVHFWFDSKVLTIFSSAPSLNRPDVEGPCLTSQKCMMLRSNEASAPRRASPESADAFSGYWRRCASFSPGFRRG